MQECVAEGTASALRQGQALCVSGRTRRSLQTEHGEQGATWQRQSQKVSTGQDDVGPWRPS